MTQINFKKSIFLIFIICSLTFSHPTSVTVKAHYNEQMINLIVWICPDTTLLSMIQSSLQNYQTIDDINASITKKVTGYKNYLWLVTTINYSRTTADTDPTPNTSSQNLCFVQVPNENFVVFIAAVIP